MTTEIQKPPQSNTIRELLKKQEGQIALALPKHLTPERFTRVALTIINKSPKLAQCTPTSLLSCIMDCAALGLEPDGRRAHLIPYGDKCTLIIDYKGLVELAMNSGNISNIHADVVCDSDGFEYNMGQITAHKIDFRKPRGNMYAAYAIVTMKDGTTKHEVMSKDEVDAIRKRSKASGSGPWVTDYNEMAKKTVFRRASKWLSLSPELREKLEKDDEPLNEPKIARPVFDEPKGFLELPVETAPEPVKEPVKEQEPVAETAPLPPTDGNKTRRLNAICQKMDIKLGDALAFFGDSGYASFEDINEEFLKGIEKSPSVFKKTVDSFVGGVA